MERQEISLIEIRAAQLVMAQRLEMIRARDGHRVAGLRIDAVRTNVIVSVEAIAHQRQQPQCIGNLLDISGFVSAALERAEQEERARAEGRVLRDNIATAFDHMAAGIQNMINDAKTAVLSVIDSDVQALRFIRDLYRNRVDQESIESIAVYLAASQARSIWTRLTESLQHQEYMIDTITRQELNRLKASITALRPVHAIDSAILPQSRDFGIFITRHLTTIGVPVERYQLLYRASRDGWNAADFHRTCDNRGATVVLVKTTTNHIFGGFALKQWTSPQGQTWVADPKAFLFSWDHKEFYDQSKQTDRTLCHWSVWNPCFGAGGDIHIGPEGRSGSSKMNMTYSTKGRKVEEIVGPVSIKDGWHHFNIDEWEVWQVVP